MPFTHPRTRFIRYAAALLAALASCTALPIPVAAQTPARPVMLEPYVSRARLAPTVVGERTRLSGAGARLLYRAPERLGRDRVLVGGYLTYAPADDRGVTTSQVGALVDLSLGGRPVAGRVEPLLSLGVGAFRTRWDDPWLGGRAMCVRPLDVGGERDRACLGTPARRRAPATHPAVSPAVGARVGLLPGVALRVDARDLVVYTGKPRHSFELTTGLSLMR